MKPFINAYNYLGTIGAVLFKTLFLPLSFLGLMGDSDVSVFDNAIKNTSASALELPVENPAMQACTDLPTLSFNTPTLISGTPGQVGARYRYTNVTPDNATDAIVEIKAINNAVLVNIDQSTDGPLANFQPQIEAVNKNLAQAFIDFEFTFFQSGSQTLQSFIDFTASGVDVDGDTQTTREFVGFQNLESFTVERTANNLVTGFEDIFFIFESQTSAVVAGIDPANTSNLVFTTYEDISNFSIRAGIKDPTSTNQGNPGAQRLFSFNFDPCLINNFTDPFTTNVFDLLVNKTVDNPSPQVGSAVTFTITVSNIDNNTPANGVFITDVLPSGLSFQSATTSAGTFNNSNGVWNVGDLPAGVSQTLTLISTVNSGTAGNVLTNTAAITSFQGEDRNRLNNTASAAVSVQNPGAGTLCFDPPFFNFSSFFLESGVPGQVGARYRFTQVRSGVDAIVEIVANSNAVLSNIDDNANFFPDAFQPIVRLNGSTNGFIDFNIRYVDAGTQTARVIPEFSASALDLDGNNSNRREQAGFIPGAGYTLEANSNLNVTTSGSFLIFTPNTVASVAGISRTATDNIVIFNYLNTSSHTIRAGITATSGTTTNHTFSYNFTGCIIDDFNNPVTTEFNADLRVQKSVDVFNPFEGDVINFTITATNLGPQAANNITLEELPPSELTFIGATASQGSFDQLSNTWNVGSIPNGQNRTLTLSYLVNPVSENVTVTNTAQIKTSDRPDPNLSNNTASVNVQIINNDSGDICQCGFQDGQFTLITVAMDGNFNEWAPVLADHDNNSCDPAATSPESGDRDYPVQSTGRDLLQFAFTWDNNNLYAFTKRLQSQTNSINFIYYADTNLDNRMQTGEPVVYVAWTGSNRNIDVFVGSYIAVDTQSGDLMVDNDGFGDGFNLPGTINGPPQGQPTRSGTWGSFSGTEMEWFVTWAELGLTPGSPISWHVSSSNATPTSNNIASQIDDNMGGCGGGAGGNQFSTLEFTIDNTAGAEADSMLTLQHKIKATGNVPDTFNFTSVINGQDVIQSIEYYHDLGTIGVFEAGVDTLLADTDADLNIDTGEIAAGDSMFIFTKYTLKPEPVSGISFVELTATSKFNADNNNVVQETVSDQISVLYRIGGTVFIDETGDALIDGDSNINDTSGDQRAAQNVVVYLYEDSGTGQPAGTSNVFVDSMQTGANGRYSFVVPAGVYFVVANSKTGDLSNGTTWAEQVWAPEGGLCEDGNGNTTSKALNGVCFGGRRGDTSDAFPANPVGADLSLAEHVAAVAISNSSKSIIDFGFSFNIVTNINDSNDDATASRTAQGSFRQFLQNANAISGVNSMRFVPAVPVNESSAGGSWWSVQVALGDFPILTDGQTVVDGTAYDLNNPGIIIDTNAGSIGTGGTVGVDTTPFATFSGKEFELNFGDLNNSNNLFLINSSTGGITVRNIAAFNANRIISISNNTNGLITQNILGARADGSQPASAGQVGLFFGPDNAFTISVIQNFIAFNPNGGMQVNNSAISGIFEQNEVRSNGFTSNNADGIMLAGNWTVKENLIHDNGSSSSNDIQGGAGIEFGKNGEATAATGIILNNTVRDNFTAGINAFDDVAGLVIDRNIIHDNGLKYAGSGTKLGAGIKMTNPDNQKTVEQVRVTKNSIFQNHGLGIDIVTEAASPGGQADGVTPNDGVISGNLNQNPNGAIDFPIFTASRLNTVANELVLEGFVGISASSIPQVFSIELFTASNDGDNNGISEVGGSLQVPHGEGINFIQTFNTGSDGRFTITIPIPGSISLNLGDFITAVATDANNSSSEFGPNSELTPIGVNVNGYVFNDANHNQVRENQENGIAGVTIVLRNTATNVCVSTAADANGFYEFTAVTMGNYELIEAYGASIPTPGSCPATEADPEGHISTTPNMRIINVENSPVVNQNFGDFEGSRLEGFVFNSNGIGGGIANNEIQDGTEAGIASVKVRALNNSNALIEETTTNGDGFYQVWIPQNMVPNGSVLRVEQVNLTGFTSVAGSAGNTGGSYDRSTDETTLLHTSGNVYTGINFADVQDNALKDEGQKFAQPGSTVFFTHQFEAYSSGSVTFDVLSQPNPSNSLWSVTLHLDQNCNGVLDPGDAIIQNSINMVAGQTICLVLKVSVPQGINEGAGNSLAVSAVFDYAGANPSLSAGYLRTDLVTIGVETETGLVLTKSVNLPTALPGTELTYTIVYINNGTQPISNLKIIDNVPAFTEFVSAACNTGNLPNTLTSCTLEAPSAGGTGSIKWTFAGSLAPGATGIVEFRVKISN